MKVHRSTPYYRAAATRKKIRAGIPTIVVMHTAATAALTPTMIVIAVKRKR